MANLTSQELASKLLAEGFSHTGPTAESLSAPIVETPMVVTLDELRPYELDPRIVRNPLYDAIKASIRERGLDAPPSITQRPGTTHYIIRNGGNTRLAILRELWAETKDERFFRIPCLFRPWPERGEIIALTGHLAESELHGGLTFIERALGVENARELYEQEDGKPLSQSELARRLSADGYPIQQSHISRMQDTVRYLLPVIPNILYSGLGRHQVEKLAVLRKAAEITWQKQAGKQAPGIEFETLFHDVLIPFDAMPGSFSVSRARDELIGRMAELFGVDYNALELDIDNIEHRQQVVTSPPVITSPAELMEPSSQPVHPDSTPSPMRDKGVRKPASVTPSTSTEMPAALPQPVHAQQEAPLSDDSMQQCLRESIVSPAPNTERLHTIQQLVAEHTGESVPVFADNVLQAIPVQAGGLFPITDIWRIDTSLDTPDRLRIHIAQFAREIASEAGLADLIEAADIGIGFLCVSPSAASPMTVFGYALLELMHALCNSLGSPLLDQEYRHLENHLGGLLLGNRNMTSGPSPRLSDNGLVKLYRLIRLARRLFDLETKPDDPDH
ncbi:ParB family protein [Pseudomonas citronellolis]|uniref:ParB family protein n=1 Tax=Pseudomonas citronellolis TaxID=53408 RepID=UPI000778E2E5|nr:ParB family protein [Pseudomonas citronellolis]AMO76071.1 ParB-like nuclease domain protein [Pseudomonas citronellolis]